MRRLSRDTALGERILLWLYWATSGYGLRASRALSGLALIVASGSALARQVAFPGACTTWTEARLFALHSVLPGLRKQQDLTPQGEVIEIVLSLFGPVLFALFLLALRGRVRRWAAGVWLRPATCASWHCHVNQGGKHCPVPRMWRNSPPANQTASSLSEPSCCHDLLELNPSQARNYYPTKVVLVGQPSP